MLPQAGIAESTALDLRGRSRHGAPDRKLVGWPHFAPAPQEDRDVVRAPQTHSQARPFTATRSKRRARRVHSRSHCSEPAQDGQADPDANPQTRLEASTAIRPHRRWRQYIGLLPPFSTESVTSDNALCEAKFSAWPSEIRLPL